MQAYGEFEVEFNPYPMYTLSEQTRYLGEFGTHAQQTVATGATHYVHGDLIRSTMLLSDESGTGVSPVSYTAFGEVLDPNGVPGGAPPTGFPRYQYAGGWAYESSPWGRNRDVSPTQAGPLTLYGVNPTLPPITLQHVGWRWYQADTGRFIQRDPIGIRGGLNVYEYAHGNPLVLVDPEGEALVCAIILIGAVALTVVGGCELWQQGGAVLSNPRPDPTINPDSGRDPRSDGCLMDCLPIFRGAITTPAILGGGTGVPPTDTPGGVGELIKWIKRFFEQHFGNDRLEG